MPGVLMIEALAQLGGILVQTRPGIAPLKNLRLTAVRQIKILGSITPGQSLHLSAKLDAVMGTLGQVTGEIRDDADNVVLTGAVTLAVELVKRLPLASTRPSRHEQAMTDADFTPATAAEVRQLRDQLDAQGKKLVFTNGCFDLLHAGHVRYLNEARALGDAMVVALNSDASVRALKGPDRPLNHENDRAEVLCALRTVDVVVVFGEDRATSTPLEKR